MTPQAKLRESIRLSSISLPTTMTWAMVTSAVKERKIEIYLKTKV